MGNHSAKSQFTLLYAASIVALTLDFCAAPARANDSPREQAIRRAIAFLSREVPAWSKDHRCYSCHNNGDGVRAILAARRSKFVVADMALADSVDWLRLPERWDTNGPDGEFSDRKLARVQFAAALCAAVESGAVDRSALQQAAMDLAREQSPDGSWEFTGADELGSPVTYGRTLATVLVRKSLMVADPQHHQLAIERTDRWLRSRSLKSVLEASAVLIGLSGATDDQAEMSRRQGLELLRRGQSTDGGWGPFVQSPPEPFDTALAMIALDNVTDPSAEPLRDHGRNYLIAAQLSDGSWPETTRPTPRESYAHRISTTAWAMIALLGKP